MENPNMTGFTEHPVKGASSAFAILFTISGILHIWQSCKYKSWFYTWLLPCACLIFTASFICREYTAFYPTNFTPVQGLFYSAVLIITFPLYFFLLRLLDTRPSFIPIRHWYLYFIPGCFFTALISLISQGTSSFFSPDSTESTVSSGLALLKASLIMQLFLNVAFVVIVAIFHYQCSSKGIFQQGEERGIKIVIITFYISITLILVRNIFSTVQIFLPTNSPVWTVEAYFWVFDVTPMIALTLLLHILHPAKYFRKGGDCYIAGCNRRVGNVEMESGSAGK